MPKPADRLDDERVSYAAPIRQSLIEFLLLLGVPRLACLTWIGLMFWVFFFLPVRWWLDLLLTGLIWAVGHGVMARLTAHEPQWTELPKTLLEPDELEV